MADTLESQVENVTRVARKRRHWCYCLKHAYFYRRFLQFHKDSQEHRSKWLCYLCIHYLVIFAFGPLSVGLIYFFLTRAGEESNEYYDEYLLLPTIWAFFVFRTITQEYLKTYLLQQSTFYQFPLSKIKMMPKMKHALRRTICFYHILWFISAIYIGFTPCMIRNWNFLGIKSSYYQTHEKNVCIYNKWHLIVIIINILGMLLFGHSLARASVILSKRWKIAIFYAKKAGNFWTVENQNYTFPTIAQVKKWHEFMLNISYV